MTITSDARVHIRPESSLVKFCQEVILGANMRGQSWYIVLLIGLMCLIRFSLAAVGYLDPLWLMTQLNIPTGSNIQMPYIIRVGN